MQTVERHSRALAGVYSTFPCAIIPGAALILALACVAQEQTHEPTLSTLTIRELNVPGLDSLNPRGLRSYAVAPDGRLAIIDAFDLENRVVTIVDTTGAVERFGRRGQGPNEFGSPIAVFVEFAKGGDTLLVYDGGNARLTTRTRTGATANLDLKAGANGWPLRLATDSIDLMPIGDDVLLPTSVVRIATTSPMRRDLLTLRDSAAVALRKTSEGRTPHIVATTQNGIVLINRYRVALQSFDATGVPLKRWGYDSAEIFLTASQIDSIVAATGPHGVTRKIGNQVVPMRTEAQVRRSLADSPVTRVAHARYDQQGRLWVLRVDGLVSVYSDTTLIGEAALPCAKLGDFAIDSEGVWLATMCNAPETDSGNRLRLFSVKVSPDKSVK